MSVRKEAQTKTEFVPNNAFIGRPIIVDGGNTGYGGK